MSSSRRRALHMKRTSSWRIVATAIPTALVAIGAGYGLGGATWAQGAPPRIYHTQNVASTTMPPSVARLAIERASTTTTTSPLRKAKPIVAKAAITTTTRQRGTTTSMVPTSVFAETSTTQVVDDNTTTTASQ